MTKSSPTSFQLKGSLFTLTVLYLLQADTEIFKHQLLELVKQSPKLFQKMPVVLDCHKLPPEAAPDFATLATALREQGLVPVGIRGVNPAQEALAKAAGLALLPNTKTSHTESAVAAPQTAAAPAKAVAITKIVKQPVRSGQQIYAKNSDLILLAPVSVGAEVIADGNIHIYSTLRGRALAGVSGNAEAQIFCHQLEAELVSIAGHYWISEDLQKSTFKKNVQIFLEKEKLQAKHFAE